MSATAKREDGRLAITPNETHVGKEGYAVKYASGPVAALCAAATDVPIGVIEDGEATTGKSTVALCGAVRGAVRVKLDATPGTVVMGSYLVITSTGTFKLDPGTGARVRVARAQEAGAANELIAATLINPVEIAGT